MRAYLLSVPYRLDEGYRVAGGRGSMGRIAGSTVPYGLWSVGSAATAAGHTVRLADGALVSEGRMAKEIAEMRPDIVGISAVSLFWERARRLAERLKTKSPATPIIVGGPHVTACREACLFDSDAIDYACVGDGEPLMVALLGAMERHADVGRIAGLVRRSGGAVVYDGSVSRLPDLDACPRPDWRLVDVRRYRPSSGHYRRLPNVVMMTSRGCPHRCLYCLSDSRYRAQSVPRVMRDLRSAVEDHGVRDVLFYDEDFAVRRRRAVELCERMIARRLNVTWSASARADTVDGELLRLMKRAGCWKLLYGVESGVQSHLDTLRRGMTIEQIERAVSLTAEAGIRPFATFMFGIPGETYRDGIRTIDFACSLKGLEFAKFVTLTPFPGTELHDNIRSYGTAVTSPEMSMHSVSFVPYTMTAAEVRSLLRTAYRRFYRRPRYVLQRLRHVRSPGDLLQNVRGLCAFIGL